MDENTRADGGPGEAPAASRHAAVEAEPAPRARTRVLHAVPVALVLIAIAVGIGVVADDHWRVGAGVLAIAAALGGVLRLALPTRLVGVLAVRSRVFDVAVFAAIAALLAGMALITVTPHP